MSWTDLIFYCAGTSAILAAGVGLWKVGAAFAVGLRRLARFLADWFGEEPDDEGNTKRPGVLRRLDQIESGQRATREEVAEQAKVLAEQARQLAALGSRVARIEKELHGDGGGTFRDQVEKAPPFDAEGYREQDYREAISYHYYPAYGGVEAPTEQPR